MPRPKANIDWNKVGRLLEAGCDGTTEEFKYCETFGNENGNGNALYLIIMQWAEQKILG